MARIVLLGGLLLFACGGDTTPSPDAGAAMLVATAGDGSPIGSDVTAPPTAVGQRSTLRIVITNHGTTASKPLVLTGLPANGLALDEARTTCAGTLLAPEQACDIVIVFSPTQAGDTVTVLSIHNGNQVTDVTITAHAASDLAFNVTSLDFGDVEIFMTPTKSVQLTNTGTDPVPLDALYATRMPYSISSTTCSNALAPGSTCSIAVEMTSARTGVHLGSLEVISGGVPYAVALTGRGLARVNVSVLGNSAGTVTSTPSGIACSSFCYAFFDGPVTLQAAPPANTTVTWSVPGCGHATTCTFTPSVSMNVDVTMALAGTPAVQLAVQGNATGAAEVEVSWPNGETARTYCDGACDVPASPGKTVWVYPLTASVSTISGPCNASFGGCSFTMPSASTMVTAAFSKAPAETWTYVTPSRVVTMATDGTGNILAGTPGELVKLSTSGTELWTVPIGVDAIATGPNDTIYVVNGGARLVKLDADGNQIWAVALDPVSRTACDYAGDIERIHGQCIAVGNDGAIVVRGEQGFARWDSTGTQTWSIPTIASAQEGVAIDATGVVYVGLEDTTYPLRTEAFRVTSDGTMLDPIRRAGCEYYNRDFAIEPTGMLLTSTSSGPACLDRSDPTLIDMPMHVASSPSLGVHQFPTGVSVSPSGRIGWWMIPDVSAQIAIPQHLSVYDPSGALIWEHDRRRGGDLYLPLGAVTFDIAMSPKDELVTGGSYMAFQVDERGFIQLFAP